MSNKNEREQEKPNIILIMSDDHGWYDTGFNGNSVVQTPNMDFLASKGVILDRFYSASAVCSPTRASVLTGRHPLRTNIPSANVGHLKKGEITIPELLKAQGYATGHFGKWHLGTLSKTEPDANRGGKEKFISDFNLPTEHGYDVFFSTESKVPTYDPMVFPAEFGEGESKRFGWKAVKDSSATKPYGTAYWVGENEKITKNLDGDDSKIIMDRLLPFIENTNKENKPFFTTIWFHSPHLPVVTDTIHRSYYKDLDLEKQLYYGAITAMDEQIGRLWKTLEARGIADNTILMYCSDNGPENKTPGSAGIFKGRKRSLYEGGLRVPAFAVSNNHFAAGKRIDKPTVTSDYLPTILDILQLDFPDNRPIDGMSILPALKGQDIERTKPIGFIFRGQQSWADNQYKLISINNGKDFELYDLINDASEKQNIIKELPEIAKKMKQELSEWLNSVENSKKGNDYKEPN
ncbi:MAG: sulfatase [Jejuia sp.]